jgi:hypothetical protein
MSFFFFTAVRLKLLEKNRMSRHPTFARLFMCFFAFRMFRVSKLRPCLFNTCPAARPPGRPAARPPGRPLGRAAGRPAFYFLKVARAAAFIKKKGECLQEKKRRANVKRSAGRDIKKKGRSCPAFFFFDIPSNVSAKLTFLFFRRQAKTFRKKK